MKISRCPLPHRGNIVDMHSNPGSVNMNTAVVITALLWILLPYMDALSTQCETPIPEDLTDMDVCLTEHAKKYLECKWQERIFISKVLFRVCQRDASQCCDDKPSDTYYDTNACLAASTTRAEHVKYSRVINEVLEQCSQRRYCILESTAGSAMTYLKTMDTGIGRVPAGVTVVYSCQKVDSAIRMSVCEARRETGDYIYLDGNVLPRNKGNLSCTCDIKVARDTSIDVNVLDVRLQGKTQLRLENVPGEFRKYTPGSAIFGNSMRFHHHQLSLHFTKESLSETDQIWINVTAPTSSITVICHGPKTSQSANTQWGSPNTYEEWYENTSLIFLIIGFLTSCALSAVLVILVMLCRRWKKRDHPDCRSSFHESEFERSCEDPIYTEANQTRASSQKSCSARYHQCRSDSSSIPSDYSVAGELKPVPKPRGPQDPTYRSVSSVRGSQRVSGCSGGSDIELVELKSQILTVCLDD